MLGTAIQRFDDGDAAGAMESASITGKTRFGGTLNSWRNPSPSSPAYHVGSWRLGLKLCTVTANVDRTESGVGRSSCCRQERPSCACATELAIAIIANTTLNARI